MLIVNCKNCFSGIKVFPCKVWRTNYCSDKCRQETKEKIREERKRNCLSCGKDFYPRLQQIKDGNAKYCSKECRNKETIKKLLSEESKKKAKQTHKQRVLSGEIVYPSGEQHPRWNGGATEARKRRIQSGKSKETLKKYRLKNPDKVREWSSKRKKLKIGRLPRGTIKNKGQQQNWKCVYCKTDISEKYHVDHIFPISKGGLHAPENIQLTCPSCNLRKSAKINFVYESMENK